MVEVCGVVGDDVGDGIGGCVSLEEVERCVWCSRGVQLGSRQMWALLSRPLSVLVSGLMWVMMSAPMSVLLSVSS